MTEHQVIKFLRDRVAERGSARALALAMGISVVYLLDVLSGRRKPGPKILRWMGVRKIVTVRYGSILR